MHAVDLVFFQWDVDTLQCKEVVLEKKLNKDNGRWSQSKEILGWLLNSR